MRAFHFERGIKSYYGRGRRDGNARDHVRWCFADSATADDFAAQFAGKRLIEPMPMDDPVALVAWGKRNVQGDQTPQVLLDIGKRGWWRCRELGRALSTA